MAEKKVVEAGKKVRDFTLKDHLGQDFRLADCSGSKVLLSFHPLAWTAVCAKQMQMLDKSAKAFEKAGTMALGVSVDSVPCKTAWAEKLKIKNTRLLCDFWPHGAVAKSLGLFREKNGFSERANVIIDEHGKVLFVKVYPIKELPDLEEILVVLRE
jgi:peroxiredoxin